MPLRSRAAAALAVAAVAAVALLAAPGERGATTLLQRGPAGPRRGQSHLRAHATSLKAGTAAGRQALDWPDGHTLRWPSPALSSSPLGDDVIGVPHNGPRL